MYEFGHMAIMDKDFYNDSVNREETLSFMKEAIRKAVDVDEDSWVVKEKEEVRYRDKRGNIRTFIDLIFPYINPYDYEPYNCIVVYVKCKGIKKNEVIFNK